MDDWRLQGQERYLKGSVLHWARHDAERGSSEHDHCEFCWRKFSTSEGDLCEGYTTSDAYHWICADCFGDFKEQFEWSLRTES